MVMTKSLNNSESNLFQTWIQYQILYCLTLKNQNDILFENMER